MYKIFNCKLCNKNIFYYELVINSWFFVFFKYIFFVFVDVLVCDVRFDCKLWNCFDVEYNSGENYDEN